MEVLKENEKIMFDVNQKIIKNEEESSDKNNDLDLPNEIELSFTNHSDNN